MSARPGLCGGYHASDIPTAISSLRFREPSGRENRGRKIGDRRDVSLPSQIGKRSVLPVLILHQRHLRCYLQVEHHGDAPV
jgi:hypothetical protein